MMDHFIRYDLRNIIWALILLILAMTLISSCTSLWQNDKFFSCERIQLSAEEYGSGRVTIELSREFMENRGHAPCYRLHYIPK